MLRCAAVARSCFTSMARRLTPAAVLLAAVLTMGSSAVQVQAEAIEIVRIVPVGSILDGSLSGSGVTIVALRPTGDTYQFAGGTGSIPGGTTVPLSDAVFLNVGSGPIPSVRDSAVAAQIGFFTTPVPAGTRLGNIFSDSKQACLDEGGNNVSCFDDDAAHFAVWKTRVEVIRPSNLTPLLLMATANVSEESLGVITGQQDEDGFAEVVVTNKGEKPIFATLQTDEPLEPADRIVDIIELDYDPETGLALYGGFLEY